MYLPASPGECYFYPRSPCGERPPVGLDLVGQMEFLSTLSLRRATLILPVRFTAWAFLSTLSLRRATLEVLYTDGPTIFLSTLSLRRATRRSSKSGRRFPYFYPRSPCGERRRLEVYKRHYLEISIHALLAESDQPPMTGPQKRRIFLSTLSLRRATPVKQGPGRPP